MSASADIRFFRDSVEGRKGEILDAAVAVFVEDGYAGGSMRAIAERLGLSEPALYRYFAGKEDLFLTLIEQTGERIRSEVGPILRTAKPDELHNTAKELLKNRQAAAKDYAPVIQTIMVASTHNPAFLEAFRASIVEPMEVLLSSFIPDFDKAFGVESVPDEMSGRVRMMMALFAGYFVMSHVFDAEELPVGDAIRRLMGWPEL